ncbi:MAG TPA: hypothetical protein VF940_30030 [Streptosporangiaceae bacterium]
MPEVSDDQTPEPVPCGRCGQPKPDDGSDWCRSCENENAAEVVAALREQEVSSTDAANEIPPDLAESEPDIRADQGAWISGPGLSEQVSAVDLTPGDVILMGDRRVTVEHVAAHGSGWVITWHAGSASGVFWIRYRGQVTRVSAFLTDQEGN